MLPAEISELYDAWKSQFDNPPDLACPFTVSSDGSLCVNDVALCPAYEIDYSQSRYGVEQIQLATKSGEIFTIFIHWPYEGKASVDRIYKSVQIYSATA